MKRFTTPLVLALAATLIGTATASPSWHGWKFVSPSRNIVCELKRDYRYLTCMLVNNRRQVVLPLYPSGRAFEVVREVFNFPDPVATPFTPVLGYGVTLTAWHLQCVSSVRWMACRTSAGHGFTIARAGIQTW
jgi:hypothetical protein